MSNETVQRAVDVAASRLSLAGGLVVIQRDPHTVQLGLDHPRRVLIENAPAGTADLLSSLDGERPTAELIDRLGRRHQVPRHSWDELLVELMNNGYLRVHAGAGSAGPTTVEPGPLQVAGGLSTDHRVDAVVVISGAGRVATSVANLLAAAGVGHVHLDPLRALRPTDVSPAGLFLDEVPVTSPPAPAESTRPRPHRPAAPRRRSPTTEDNAEPPRRADREALAAMIRRVSPQARVHPPRGYVPPTLVVLADDGPPHQGRSRSLVGDRIPHLAAQAGETRGVVGPLVIPGRSSCLHCHDLHRRDRDPGWPLVLLAQQSISSVPAPVLATAVAATAAQQVLQFLDGRRLPDTVDGTLELANGDWAVRRRSWRPHPGCFCQSG